MDVIRIIRSKIRVKTEVKEHCIASQFAPAFAFVACVGQVLV